MQFFHPGSGGEEVRKTGLWIKIRSELELPGDGDFIDALKIILVIIVLVASNIIC